MSAKSKELHGVTFYLHHMDMQLKKIKYKIKKKIKIPRPLTYMQAVFNAHIQQLHHFAAVSFRCNCQIQPTAAWPKFPQPEAMFIKLPALQKSCSCVTKFGENSGNYGIKIMSSEKDFWDFEKQGGRWPWRMKEGQIWFMVNLMMICQPMVINYILHIAHKIILWRVSILIKNTDL